MAMLHLIGARPLACLMAIDRLAAEAQSDRCAASVRESASGSRVSHSQTTNDDQPASFSAASVATSRARLRPIFSRQ